LNIWSLLAVVLAVLVTEAVVVAVRAVTEQAHCQYLEAHTQSQLVVVGLVQVLFHIETLAQTLYLVQSHQLLAVAVHMTQHIPH
jgi:hypothetical protein